MAGKPSAGVIGVTHSAPTGGGGAPEPVIPRIAFDRFELANGLTVIVHEDRREPRVYVGMNYRVGSKDEQAGVNTGFAHLFEHLMFGGSEQLPGPYVARMKKAGALDVNGMTSHDSTVFYQLVFSGMLEFTLFAEADRMANVGGQLRQEVLDQQRQIVLMEKRQREGEALGRLPDSVSRGLYAVGHPYRHPVVGEEIDLRAATLEAAHAWSARYYTPSNAVLVLVGDVGVDQARDMVARQFGHIPPGPPLLRPSRWVQRSAAARRDVLEDPLVSEPMLHVAWSTADVADPESELVGLAVSVLTEGRPSLLAKELVRDGGPVRDVSVQLLSERLCGQVGVMLRLAPDADMVTVEQDLRSALQRLFATPPGAEPLNRLCQQQLQGLNRAFESLQGKADVLTRGQLVWDDPAAYEQAARRWSRGVQPEAVRQAAVQCFGAEPHVLRIVPRSHPRFVAGSSAPTGVPDISAAGSTPPQLHATRFSVGPGVPAWHAKSPDPERFAMRLLIDRGLADLPRSERPLAMLLTKLTRMGLGGRSANEQEVWLARAGLHLQCWCDGGAFSVQLGGAIAALPQAVELLTDIVGWSSADRSLQDEGFSYERQQGIQLAQSHRSDPIGLAASRPQVALLAKADSLHLDPEEVVTALVAATLDEARAVHRKLFDPRCASLIVVGNVTTGSLLQRLDQGWKAWKSPTESVLRRVDAAPMASSHESAPPVALVEAGQAGQTWLFGACAFAPFDPGEGWALDALVHLVGGDLQSRLSRRLRDELHLTYGIRAGVAETGHRLAARLLTFQSALDPVQAVAGLIEIRRLLTEVCTSDPPSEEEVDAFRRDMTLRLPSFARDPAELCGALAFQHHWGLDGTYWVQRANELQRLSTADVQAAARALLAPGNFRWALAGDAAVLRAQLEERGFPVQVHACPSAETAGAPSVREPTSTIDG